MATGHSSRYAASQVEKAIYNAQKTLHFATIHEQEGLPASASAMLESAICKLGAVPLDEDDDSYLQKHREVLEICQTKEKEYRVAAHRQMQTYGLLQLHTRDLSGVEEEAQPLTELPELTEPPGTTMLLILCSGQLKYYALGNTEEEGAVYLHQIEAVESLPDRENAFSIKTGETLFTCRAPDRSSLVAWTQELLAMGAKVICMRPCIFH